MTTSQVDTVTNQREIGLTQSLPIIQEGRTNLVSPPQDGRQPSFKEKASEWAADARQRLCECAEQQTEVSEGDVQTLRVELVRAFITALQQDSRASWMLLSEILGLVEPFKKYLAHFDTKAELFHYLERMIHHVTVHRERLFDLQIIEALTQVFPQEISEIRQSKAVPARNYCTPCPPLITKQQSPRKIIRTTLPNGTDLFDPRLPAPDEAYIVVKPLTFGDIRKSFGTVALEVAAREAVWSHCIGNTVQALATDIPEEPSSPSREPSRESTKLSSVKKDDETASNGEGTKVTPSPRQPMTGREAVQYFSACHHIGKIESKFFNVAPSRHFRPYDLIEVPENKVQSEHYLFSTFSILHVQPDQPNEKLSLAEWQREAVLWNAVSHIPFFKNYLLRKMFIRWRANKLQLDFQRKQRTIAKKLLHAVPGFGAALLQISRLLKELLTLNFLPFEADKSYSLSNFENLVNYKNIQADKILDKFFKYCKLTVDVTAEECFKILRHCEEQVKKKTVFSKDSLHLQRLKKEQREENLRKARSEAGRLGNFVKLIDQMIVEHLFDISKSQVITFVHRVLKSQVDAAARDGRGMFKANLVFTKKDVLGLSPSKEKIVAVVTNTMSGIPSVLCAKVIPMDSSGGCREAEEPPTSAPSSPAKSTSSILKTLDLKRRQASAMTSGTAGSGVAVLPSISDTDRAARSASDISDDRDSEAESKGTNMAAVAMTTVEDGKSDQPDLPRWTTPTKEDDEIGVATPDLVLRCDMRMVVEGEGFIGQYEPLSRASLEDKLQLDKEFMAALDLTRELLEAAILEVDQYCEANNWLNEIHQFSRRWTDRCLRDYRGVAAFTIEQKLNELRLWSERIRNFDQSYLTENGLLYLDCMSIHEGLLPRLDAIYQQLVTFVADEVKRLAKGFCSEMSTIVHTLKDKRKNVEAFASYAKSFNQYKKNTATYQQQLDYAKSLFEVIRMSYRQLTPEEEKLEENVWAMWEAFLFQMQDASEFVNTQTPLFTQELEDTYTRLKHAKTRKQQNEAIQPPSIVMILEKEAYELCELGTTGKFLNPEQNPTEVLGELRVVRQHFFSVRERLTDASWRREAICGEPYDLTFLNELTMKMDLRQEVWKYLEVSTQAINDWKQLLFKKLNTRKALEKLNEWQTAAAQLKMHLPPDDLVLIYWYRALQDFKRKLPLLHKLRNEALKERHWRRMFVGIGEVYEPEREFLVCELLAYNLDEHSQLIDDVYSSALAEYDLEQKMTKVAKFWNDREFKIAKHIPDSILDTKASDANAKTPTIGSRRRNKLQKFRQEKAAAETASLKSLDVVHDDYYILIEQEELKYQLEDSLISVKAMLHSPHVAGIQQEVEFWSDALQQIEEITDLWVICQKKWMYLLKVFEKPDMYRKLAHLSLLFEGTNKKFKDYMRIVSSDSKCMHAINTKRGEKGYRLLQGDNLRDMLLTLLQSQEEILKQLETMLGEARMQFPRLYFLSDSELVELLGISRNPRALLPSALKCFPGVRSLEFSLPPGLASLNSTLDFALHADKLEGTHIHGRMGETVPLCAKLEAYPQPTKWLSTLERIMKNTMAEVLQASVQARMEAGAMHPIHVLEELSKMRRSSTFEGRELGDEIRTTYRHWLLRFPGQCVLTSEAILWEKSMHRILEKEDKEDMDMLKSNLQMKLDQYVDILRDESSNYADRITKQRLRMLVSNLVNQSIYTRDVMNALMDSGNISLGNFDWLKVLKYHIEIKTVLRAKTETSDEASTASSSKSSTPATPLRKSKLGAMDKIPEEPPKLSRTKTTVSSAYSFSQCFVHMFSTPYAYDYEYMGPCERLVTTPLTERAFLSLTQSMQSFHCGALIGPPATGKTETIHDLSTALGRHLVRVNCNEDITLPMMTQYLSGMIQSGSWALFDHVDRLDTGLMSVLAQQVDYLRSALKALNASSSSQYNIRGQPKYDKKPGASDKVIRRNSLTTLHPLPPGEKAPALERQNTVPHGFNEKGLCTYFEDTWVEEREGRRHSIEKEILIQESELYKSNKPPPLFYEHVKFSRKKSPPDYSKLGQEMSYHPRYLGNLMFNGKLMLANANYGCFMTLNTDNPTYTTTLPQQLRILLRPCAMIQPDIPRIVEMLLCSRGFEEFSDWTNKLCLFVNMLSTQLPRRAANQVSVRTLKAVITVAAVKKVDRALDREIQSMIIEGKESVENVVQTQSVRSREEYCLVRAISHVISPRMADEDDRLRLQNILRDVFPSATRSSDRFHGYDPRLVKAVREQLKENHLTDADEFVLKILQLQTALNLKQAVMLVGPTGCGKTTCYETLGQAWNALNYQLFSPDHSKDELYTDRNLTRRTSSMTEDEDEFYDYDALQVEDKLLKDLTTRESEARTKWKKSEKTVRKIVIARVNFESDAVKDKYKAEFPKVDIFKFIPSALPAHEVFGYFENGIWEEGILTKVLRGIDFQGRSVKTVLEQMRAKMMSSKQQSQQTNANLPSNLLQWVVLDGAVSPSWAENLNGMLDEGCQLVTADGEKITHQESTSLIFETTDLSAASPATVARGTVIHFGSDLVNWKWLYNCWAVGCKNRYIMTSTSLQMLDDMVTEVFGPTIKFLANNCDPSLLADVSLATKLANRVTAGILEVTSFLKILSALMDKCLLREEFEKRVRRMELEALSATQLESEGEIEDGGMVGGGTLSPSRSVYSRMTTSTKIEETLPCYTELLKSMFAFAYVWSFGGHIHESHKDTFDQFARDVLYRCSNTVRLPVQDSVFDYRVDESTGNFVRWSDQHLDKPRGLPATYIVTPEVDRYHHMVDLLLTAGHPVLLTGSSGVGKTSLVKNIISNKHKFVQIRMSHGVSSRQLQDKLMAHLLDPQRGYGGGVPASALMEKSDLTFFIDDISTAPAGEGVECPLEGLRQILTQGGIYDSQRKVFLETGPANFLTVASTPSGPGSGLDSTCHVMSSRLTRLFVTLTYFSPCPESVLSMVTKPIRQWLEEFPTYSVDHHQEFATALATGILDMYHAVREKFRPTPAHAHYLFSFHDISRVLQGLQLMSPRSRTRKLRIRRREREDPKKNIAATMMLEESLELSRKNTLLSMGSSVNSYEISAPMMKVIAQLWCHECSRVFGDRLVSDEDTSWYEKTLEEVAIKHFCMPREEWRLEMAAIHEETQSQGYDRSTPLKNAGSPRIHSSGGEVTPSENEWDGTMDNAPISPKESTPRQGVTCTPSNAKNETNTGDSSSPSISSDNAVSLPETTAASTLTTTSLRTSDRATKTPESSYPTQTSSEVPITARTCTTEETLVTETLADTTLTEVIAEQEVTSDDEVTEDSSTEENATSEESDSEEVSDLGKVDNETSGKGEEAEAQLTDGDRVGPESTFDTTLTGMTESPLHGQPHSIPSDTENVLANRMPKLQTQESVTSSGRSSQASGFRRISKLPKRGVTFKAGLIYDRDQGAYDGPLMSVEELKGSYNSLTDVIFSKYYMKVLTESRGETTEKGYVETPQEQLSEALYLSLRAYNLGTNQRLDMAFFSNAIRHAARLSRVMAIPGGHALLLGISYCTGRSTLTKLASFIAQQKVFEPKPQANMERNRQVMREHIRRCCHHAGVLKKGTVLLVHESLGEDSLGDVATLMSEGTCPGLYSEEELQEVVSQMMPGGVLTKKVDKIEQAFERFLKKIRQNLHVIVCLNYRGNSFSSDFNSIHMKLQKYPCLVKQSVCIDVYRQWEHSAYVTIANRWLRYSQSKIMIPWNDIFREEQINLICSAMAYMHVSARAAVERQFCHQREPLRFYTPLTFMEFTRMFRIISAHLVRKEEERIEKHKALLGKMNEALTTIHQYKKEVSSLTPKHHKALETIHKWLNNVEDGKKAYIEELEQCKAQEERIVELQKPLDHLRRKLSSAFDKAQPTYEAAKMALKALGESAGGELSELKSYRHPPITVRWVVSALSVLFGKEQDWESGKLLLLKDNFINDLIFYDKENIPNHIFKNLEAFVNHPAFTVGVVKQSSAALGCLCMYVHAVYQYALIHRGTDPIRRELSQAEDVLEKAQAKLGQMRIEATRRKSILEQAIESHKEAVKNMRVIEKQIGIIEKIIKKCNNVVSNMKMQHTMWKSELKKAKSQIETGTGDALITAACVCYFGPLDDKTRAELLQDWTERCHHGNFITESQSASSQAASAKLESLMAENVSGKALLDYSAEVERLSNSVGSECRSRSGKVSSVERRRTPEDESIIGRKNQVKYSSDNAKRSLTDTSSSDIKSQRGEGHSVNIDDKVNQSVSAVDAASTSRKSSEGGRSSVLASSLPVVQTFKYRPSIYESSVMTTTGTGTWAGKFEQKSLEEDEDDGLTLLSFGPDESDSEDAPSPLRLRSNYSLQEILSDQDEINDWTLGNLPADLHALQNALIMRVCCFNRKHFWPLLVDPDNQAEVWVRTLQKSRNIIQENELVTAAADGLSSEDLPEQQDFLYNSSGDPASRAVSHTGFSDVTAFTEYTLADETISGMESRAQTSVSRRTKESDDLRPLTSVTNPWERYSVTIEVELQAPEDGLWVLEADNPQLNSHLINAVTQGITVLVTHLERRPLDPVFRGILMKQLYVDAEGGRVVRVGRTDYPYHPDFRLYLSISTPLFMKGDGLYEVPVHKMCVINMALSDEAVMNHVLQETMLVERREFDAQLRSNDTDTIYQNRQLNREHEVIIEKTLTLACPLLQDKTMLPSLHNCQQNVDKHLSILEETRFMREHLELKRVPYLAMATQATMLYSMVKRMSVLHPLYYLPFYQFMDMFRRVIRSRDRGKGVAGDLQARSQELSDATTSMVYKYCSMMMFEKHVILFSLLVAMETMRMKGQLTSQEMALFINGFEITDDLNQDMLVDQKPAWISDKTWIDCTVLEALHKPFTRLRDSFVAHSAQWQEYFNRPFSLINAVPGEDLTALTVFQKCLLWKVFSPEKLSLVAQALIVYELGSVIQQPDHYNIREVYNYADKSRPIIFVMPNAALDSLDANGTRGLPYVDPIHELKRLAKEEGMEGKVRILNYGVHTQMSEVKQAIEDCISNGYWLLLENYHLAEPLDLDTFSLLKAITHSRWNEERDMVMYEDEEEATRSLVAKSDFTPQIDKTLTVSETFRLFVTTPAEGGQLIPGILIQHGIKVTCEATQNFKSALQKSYRNVAFLLNGWLQPPPKGADEAEWSGEKSMYIMPLALLHAVLLQRRYYGNITSVNTSHWSLVDLVSVAELLRAMSVQCNRVERTAAIMAQTYTGHCTDLHDSDVTQAIAMALLRFPESPSGSVSTNLGIEALLEDLLNAGGNPFSLKNSLDALRTTSASNFCLPDLADQQLKTVESRILSGDMIRVSGAAELFTMLRSPLVEKEIEDRLQLGLQHLQNCPQLPKTSRDELYPFDMFLHYEVENYKQLLRTVQSDLHLMLRHAKGEISLSNDLQRAFDSVCRNEVPQSWFEQTFPSATIFTDWTKALPRKLQMLLLYMEGTSNRSTYHLSVFLRPEQFLQATLHDHARRQFHNIEFLHYEPQIMPAGIVPSSAPSTGIYLAGLSLHNAVWDQSRSALDHLPLDSSSPSNMPLIWLKPVDKLPSQVTSQNTSVPIKYDVYDCPVFFSKLTADTAHRNIITRIALPTAVSKSLWLEKSVYMSCDLPNVIIESSENAARTGVKFSV